MFVYFKHIDSFLTCDEYPLLISSEIMKKYNLEYKCNRWIHQYYNDGTFTLSFKYKKQTCDCDKSMFNNNINSQYDCFLCKNVKLNFKDEEMLYLQNSGCQDVVCVKNINSDFSKLKEIEGHPNMYAWNNNNTENIFALHTKIVDESTQDSTIYLSDDDMKDFLNCNQNIESCHVIFTNDVENDL
jgi:hypothetical protein